MISLHALHTFWYKIIKLIYIAVRVFSFQPYLSYLCTENLTCWKTNLIDEIKQEFGADLEKFKNKSFAFYDNAGDLDKNPLAIAKTLELAWADGKKSILLSELTDRIIEFAKNLLNHKMTF